MIINYSILDNSYSLYRTYIRLSPFTGLDHWTDLFMHFKQVLLDDDLVDA